MTGVRAGETCLRAHPAMFMVVLVALFGAHAADLFADHQKFFGDFGISLNQPGGLDANVSTVAVKLDAPGKQGDIFFVQAGRFTLFTSESTVDQFLKQFFVSKFCVVG